MNNSKFHKRICQTASAVWFFALIDPVHAALWEVEFGGNSYQANNSVSIDEFDGRFAGYKPRHSQLYALAENSAYLQANVAGFTLQAYKKQEIFINAGRETGQLFADINARTPPTRDKTYVVGFDGYGMEQTGVGISKRFETGTKNTPGALRINPTARLYNIDRYREIQASGLATARTNGSYDIAVNTLERDTRADFTFPVGNAPMGMGYAIDLAANWQISPAVHVFATLQDLFNYNNIKNAPTTAQTLNSNVNQFDADGLLNYNPAIQGINSRERYRFSLPVKTHVGLHYATSTPHVDSVGMDVRHIQGLVLTRLSANWVKAFNWLEGISVGYETHFESFDIDTQFKYGGVRVGFDTLSDKDRRVEFLKVYFKANW